MSILFEIKTLQVTGNVAALEQLLATPLGKVQAQVEKGYKGAYYMLVCQCNAATSDKEIDKLCGEYPDEFRKKTKKKKETWNDFVEKAKKKLKARS